MNWLRGRRLLAYLNDGDRLEDWASPRNLARQYDFMSSSFVLWQDQGRPELSERFLAELNFYAAHLVSPYPGQFRHQVQYNVDINGTPHSPPPWGKVEQYLHEFMLNVNDRFQSGDVLDAAAYALCRLNWIHPFAQGNGRTSRAVCYFIVCQKLDRWLPGVPILPELI